MHRVQVSRIPILVVLTGAILGTVPGAAGLVAEPAALAKGLAGKHYASVVMLRDPGTGVLAPDQACLSFRKGGQLCADGGDCGPWAVTDERGRQRSWEAEIVVLNDGTDLRVELFGIVETRGRKSSIAATLFFEEFNWNGSLSGVEASRAACIQWALEDD